MTGPTRERRPWTAAGVAQSVDAPLSRPDQRTDADLEVDVCADRFSAAQLAALHRAAERFAAAVADALAAREVDR